MLALATTLQVAAPPAQATPAEPDASESPEQSDVLDELMTESDWLGEQLVALGSTNDAPLSVGVRPDLDAVVLHLPADGATDAATRSLVADAERRLGDNLRIAHDARVAHALACVAPYCDPPLRAGVGITHSSNQYSCTAAFLVRSRLDRVLYQLTAGHCAYGAAGGSWYTRFSGGSAHTIGPVHRYTFGSTGDMALIRVNNPTGWRARAWTYVTAGPDTSLNESYKISAVGRSAVGARVCISGATTAQSDCGTVTEVNVTTQLCAGTHCPTIRGLTRASLCAQAGDSGAPIYARNTAYGMLSGGYSACDVVYQEVATAAAGLNVTVSTER